MEMADWIRLEEPSFHGVDKDTAEDLAGELASVRYKIDSSGRIVIESKDDMKSRGLRSPDLADALGVTFARNSEMVFTKEFADTLAALTRRRR